MVGAVRLSKDKEQEILRLWFQNRTWTVHRVAVAVGVTDRAVQRVLRDTGSDVSGRRACVGRMRQQRDDDIRREVREAVASRGRVNLAEVGRKYDVSREWVRRLTERR